MFLKWGVDYAECISVYKSLDGFINTLCPKLFGADISPKIIIQLCSYFQNVHSKTIEAHSRFITKHLFIHKKNMQMILKMCLLQFQ